MSKSKPDKDGKKSTPESAKDAAPPDGGWRETVESVAMAVILALLFRGFVAEAFVIPTGSMAPTLVGRHKDIKCPQCKTWYQTSCSDEQDQQTSRPSGTHVYSATCPVCRFSHCLDPIARPNEGSFSGDRIIVAKFAYDLAEPKRWDVIVFKYPGGAAQNYIKRLIGLPGERVRVVGGNIYTRGNDEPEEALRIARKPPAKLTALLQMVDDTDHIPKALTDVGWPSAWQSLPAENSPWQVIAGGREFVCDQNHSGETWLRYRNLKPSHADWQVIETDHRLPADVADRPGQLIADFYAYNTSRSAYSPTVPWWRTMQFPAYRPPMDHPCSGGLGDPPPNHLLGQHWVDDLALECVADVTSEQGELTLMLVRAGTKHLCRINLADGKATLSMNSAQGSPIAFMSDDGKSSSETPTGSTSVRGPGKYRLRLSNCDHEMLLWVNGRVIAFDGPTTYDPEGATELPVPFYSPDDPGDLAPAGVASRGASLKVSQLRIFRDKYYVATDQNSPSSDYDRASGFQDIQKIFADPSQWAASGLFTPGNRRHVEFPLDADQFLPMGDNSPHSFDGRFWGPEDNNPATKFPVDHHFVQRDLLIGKALMIYWPHTWNRPVPFLPKFDRMGPIR